MTSVSTTSSTPRAAARPCRRPHRPRHLGGSATGSAWRVGDRRRRRTGALPPSTSPSSARPGGDPPPGLRGRRLTWWPTMGRRSSGNNRRLGRRAQASTTTCRLLLTPYGYSVYQGRTPRPRHAGRLAGMITGSERAAGLAWCSGAQYGSAEVRPLHVDRGGPSAPHHRPEREHHLAGDIGGTYLSGDNAKVLTTDTQKNTVYALRQAVRRDPRRGVRPTAGPPLRGVPSVGRGRCDRAVRLAAYRCGASPSAFLPSGWPEPGSPASTYATAAHRDRGSRGRPRPAQVVGLGVPARVSDRWLHPHSSPRTDRILATAVWPTGVFAGTEAVWDASFAGARAALAETFAANYSRSPQQTLRPRWARPS